MVGYFYTMAIDFIVNEQYIAGNLAASNLLLKNLQNTVHY